jgi:hypothetical protein
MVWTQEEIEAYKGRRSQTDGNLGKVDDFVNSGQGSATFSPRSPTATRKWKPTPTDENRRSDEWLGSPNKTRRSWKVKETPSQAPVLDDSK